MEEGASLVEPSFRVHLPWKGASALSPPADQWEALPAGAEVAEEGDAAEAAAEAAAQTGSAAHVRWKQTFSGLGPLCDLNETPYAFLVLGDRAAGRGVATAVAAPQGAGADDAPGRGDGKSSEEGAEGRPAVEPRGRNFLGHVHLDLSPLLVGETLIAAHFASEGSPYHRSGAPGGTAASYLAPHSDLWELEVAIGTSSGKAAVDEEALAAQNPLHIAIRGAVDLPGLRLEAARLQPYVSGSCHPFTQQRAHCKPTYAVLRLPSSWSQGRPRLVVTPGALAAPEARWEHRAAFYTTGVARGALEQEMERGAVRVELHDRDPVAPAGDPERGAYRLECALSTCDMVPPPGKKDAELAEKLRRASAADRDSLDAAEAPGASQRPERLIAVDRTLLLPLIVEEWQRAADDCAHGYCDAKLADLLDQSRQLAAAFRMNRSERNGRKAESGATPPRSLSNGDDGGGAATSTSPGASPGAAEQWEPQGGSEGASRGAEGRPAEIARVLPMEGEAPSTLSLMDIPRTGVGAPVAPVPKGPACKARLPIAPTRRRVMPKKGTRDGELSEAERLVRQPGRYFETDAMLRLTFQLHRPQRSLSEGSAEFTGAPTLARRPFTRAVHIFDYGATDRLVALMAAMDAENVNALGGDHVLRDRGSLRSLALTAEERKSADGASLDVVCGFQVIDEDCRMVIIEGLADGAMARIERALPRISANGADYRVLSSVDERFHERLYTPFGVDLKKVRLRRTLPELADMPDLYNSARVARACAVALLQLAELRRVDRLAEAASLFLFPAAAHLLEVEATYGESISLADIEGFLPGGKQEDVDASAVIFGNTAAHDAGAAPADGEATPAARASATTPAGGGTALTGKGAESGVPRSAAAALASAAGARQTERRPRQLPSASEPLDCWNAAFDGAIKGRSTRNFVLERRLESLRVRREARQKAEERRARALAASEALKAHGGHPSGRVYMYSGQRCNHAEAQKRLMRERLKKVRNACFTYSKDFQSQSVPLVGDEALTLFSREADPSKWRTERGFLYPAPKSPGEYNAHPKKPSASRVAMLREPWVENQLHHAPVARASDAAALPASAPRGRAPFDATSCGPRTFGGYLPPEFQREYDSRALGNRARLPRGRMSLRSDRAFFRSVHLVGEAQAKEAAAAAEAERKLWRSKVVVDDLTFHVAGYLVKDKPGQLDRRQDILRGRPIKRALRMVRNAKLPSGKRVPLRQAPHSIFSGGEHANPRDATLDLRSNDMERFCGTDKDGSPVTFVTSIHRDAMKPRSQTIQWKRKIAPLRDSERDGPVWSARSGAGRWGNGSTLEAIPPCHR